MDYLADARIDAARRYLESTDLTFKEVAHRRGFDIPDGFRRVFSQRLRITLVDYRQCFHAEGDGQASGLG